MMSTEEDIATATTTTTKAKRDEKSVLNINGREKWVKFSFSFSHCVL